MTHIQQRRDTSATWFSVNPVLYEGEVGHETDTGRSKLGDGVTPYDELPYQFGVHSVAGKVGDVSLVVADVTGAAPTASPSFTGNPTAPTPMTADDDTTIATTQFVKNVVAPYAPLVSPVLMGNPTAPTPSAGDDDISIATTAFVQAQKASPAFTGNPTAPTPLPGDDDTSIATTAFVRDAVRTLAPRGVLGFTQVTANQLGLTGAETDLTGLALSVTVGTSRRIRVTVYGNQITTVATSLSTTRIRNTTAGSAVVADQTRYLGAANIAEGFHLTAVLTPAAGVHSFKATMFSGAGNTGLSAAPTVPAYIMVEDIGAA